MGDHDVKIENIERLGSAHVMADVEIDGKLTKNTLVARRKRHYAIVILDGAQPREIPVPESLDEQLGQYLGPQDL
jgi:hypothetical protein